MAYTKMVAAVATAVLFLAVTMAPRWTEAQQLPPMPKVNPVCALAKLPETIKLCYLSGNVVVPSQECCNDLKSANSFQVNCLCDNFLTANANFTRSVFDSVHTACGVLDKFSCKEGETKKEEGSSNNTTNNNTTTTNTTNTTNNKTTNSNVGTKNKAAASISVFGLVGILFFSSCFSINS